MRAEVGARLRKAALLSAIAGVHLLLLRNMLVGNGRGMRTAEEAPGILFFIEIPRAEDTPPTAPSSPQPVFSARDSRIDDEAARDNAITLPLEIESPIDWDAEGRRAAGEIAGRDSAEKEFRSFDRHPPGMGPLPPKSPRHEAGDSQHFEGGEIITWINDRCYFTNENYRSPYPADSGFGADLRLQLPVCKGAASVDPLPSLEEWMKHKGEPDKPSALP